MFDALVFICSAITGTGRLLLQPGSNAVEKAAIEGIRLEFDTTCVNDYGDPIVQDGLLMFPKLRKKTSCQHLWRYNKKRVYEDITQQIGLG